jgi:hypothetical protein
VKASKKSSVNPLLIFMPGFWDLPATNAVPSGASSIQTDIPKQLKPFLSELCVPAAESK